MSLHWSLLTCWSCTSKALKCRSRQDCRNASAHSLPSYGLLNKLNVYDSFGTHVDFKDQKAKKKKKKQICFGLKTNLGRIETGLQKRLLMAHPLINNVYNRFDRHGEFEDLPQSFLWSFSNGNCVNPWFCIVDDCNSENSVNFFGPLLLTFELAILAMCCFRAYHRNKQDD